MPYFVYGPLEKVDDILCMNGKFGEHIADEFNKELYEKVLSYIASHNEPYLKDYIGDEFIIGVAEYDIEKALDKEMKGKFCLRVQHPREAETFLVISRGNDELHFHGYGQEFVKKFYEIEKQINYQALGFPGITVENEEL